MRFSLVSGLPGVLAVAVLGSVAAVAQQPALSSAAPSNPVAAQSLDDLSAMLDRPLFSPSRRPAKPPLPPPGVEAAAPPAPPSAPNLVLLGVVVDGEGARAVVRTSGDGKILHMQIGDDIDGWKVSQIEGRKVVLSLDGSFATFALFSRDRARQEAAREPMPGTAPKDSQRQNGVQQTAVQAPTAGQPARRRRSRE